MSLTILKQMACQALRIEADLLKLEALCVEAGYYVLGLVKLFERRVAEMWKSPPSKNREHELADLNTGLSQEWEKVAWRISAAEFRRRRNIYGLAEIPRVEGEYGAGTQHADRWREIPGGACTTAAGVKSRYVSGRQGHGQGRVCPAGEGNSISRNNSFDFLPS